MKYFVILLLVLELAFAATLLSFDLDTENTCDGTDEITLVTVTDSGDGDPVENAYVKVEDISPWKQKTSGLADSDGEFEFEGCGDTWNVSASYGGYATKTITITLGSCGSCNNPTPPTPPPAQNTSNTTNTSTPPSTPPPTTPPPAASNDSSSNTTTTSTTTTTTSNLPSYPADTSSADSADETEDEGDSVPKKKPLPCCASSSIIIGLVGVLTFKARK